MAAQDSLRDLADLTCEIEGHLATLTLDRPSARNAYSAEMIDSIVTAFDVLEEDDAIWCVVLTGAGTTFSAGGDLKAMQSHSGMFEGRPVRLRSRYLRGIQRIPRRLASFEKPVIAAINGPAIGAGLDLACMCDIRVAARGARFGSTFVRLGLIPGDGGAFLLSRVVGFPKALELILAGQLVDTEEAQAIGLVNAVVEPDELMDEARRWASRIMANAPLAVQLAKSACYRSWGMKLDGALNLAATYQSIAQNTGDHQEGVEAMLERRSPEFSGKD